MTELPETSKDVEQTTDVVTTTEDSATVVQDKPKKDDSAQVETKDVEKGHQGRAEDRNQDRAEGRREEGRRHEGRGLNPQIGYLCVPIVTKGAV